MRATAPTRSRGAPSPGAKGVSNRRRALLRFLRNRLAVAGAIVLILLVAVAALAPWLVQDPLAVDLQTIREAPSSAHWLGGDPAGRDVLARVVFASRISLFVGLASVALQVLIGLVLGLVAGYLGGWVDALIMRLTDTMMALPSLLLILMFVAIAGAGLTNIVLALALTRWTNIARLVRSQVLALKEVDFVAAARATGLRAWRIMAVHLLPNSIGPVIVASSFAVGSAILTEAALSFLGLGIRPPTPSWGQMLNEARSVTILREMPWFWIPPGLAIALCVLSANFIGDGLRDALDPRR